VVEMQTVGTGGRVMRTAACQSSHHSEEYIYIATDLGWIGREESDGGDLDRGQREK